MSTFICSLNSGSNGNCYYIGNANEAILVDAGLSCSEMEARMERQGLSMSRVHAIFISHEHTDHISGLRSITKKHKVPVYITEDTRQHAKIKLAKEFIREFKAGEPVTIGELSVTAFAKSHDAIDPHSFMVTHGRVNIGIFTDIGYAGKEVIKYFKVCHAAFLESNYCEDMLETGSYPRYLKKRINGRKGHLSNKQALELFMSHRSAQLSHLVLSHLSENNNKPDLVDKLFNEQAGKTRIIVASRNEESPVYQVIPSAISRSAKKKKSNEGQLSLF